MGHFCSTVELNNFEEMTTVVPIQNEGDARINIEEPLPGLESDDFVEVGKSAIKSLEAWQRHDLSTRSPILYYGKLFLYGILLSFIRLQILTMLCVVFCILAGIAFLGMPKGSEFKDLVGWRRSIMETLPKFCRAFLFVAGVYKIERTYVTEEELKFVREKFPTQDDAVEYTTPTAGVEEALEAGDETQKQPHLIVCNHISMLDPVVVMAEFGVTSAVAAPDLLKYPLISTIAKQLQLLFVSRKTKAQLIPAMQQRAIDYNKTIKSKTSLPPRLMIFPEGTTTGGHQFLYFHAGAFVVGDPVTPFVLRYPYKNYNAAWVESWIVFTHLYQLLSNIYQEVEVLHFPTYYPTEQEKMDPLLYAKNVRQTMCTLANMKWRKEERYVCNEVSLTNFKYQRVSRTKN